MTGGFGIPTVEGHDYGRIEVHDAQRTGANGCYVGGVGGERRVGGVVCLEDSERVWEAWAEDKVKIGRRLARERDGWRLFTYPKRAPRS